MCGIYQRLISLIAARYFPTFFIKKDSSPCSNSSKGIEHIVLHIPTTSSYRILTEQYIYFQKLMEWYQTGQTGVNVMVVDVVKEPGPENGSAIGQLLLKMATLVQKT